MTSTVTIPASELRKTKKQIRRRIELAFIGKKIETIRKGKEEKAYK